MNGAEFDKNANKAPRRFKTRKNGKGRLNPTQRHGRAKEKVLRGFVRGLGKLRS